MTDRTSIGPREIGRILDVVRGLGIHPEAVRVPLDAEGSGQVRIEGGRLLVVAPASGDLDAFVTGLAGRIAALPGSGSLKRA